MDQENISQDSIELLHECDKGIQMGLSAMHQVADKISDDQFRSVLEKSRNTHENLKDKMNAPGTKSKIFAARSFLPRKNCAIS